MWPEAPGTKEPEVRETHFTALLCNLKSHKHFWESKPFIIHTVFIAKGEVMLTAFRNHSVICRLVISFFEDCCNFKKICRFAEMLSRNRHAKHLSLTGRHHVGSSPKCSFAFNIFRNFLKKTYLNYCMNSVSLAMLIYQNCAFIYPEISVDPFLLCSPSLICSWAKFVHVKKEEGKQTGWVMQSNHHTLMSMRLFLWISLDCIFFFIWPGFSWTSVTDFPTWHEENHLIFSTILHDFKRSNNSGVVLRCVALRCVMLCFDWMCFAKERHYALSLKVLL